MTVDASIINLALPTMQRELELTRTDSQWLITGYLLSLGGLLILGGRLADRFDSRKVLVAGWTVLGLASTLGAIAVDTWTVLVARIGQGAGAALIAPVSVALITQTISDSHRRQKVLALWSGVGSLGFALGTIGGGYAVAQLGWRAVFALNIPLVVVGLLGLRAIAAPPVLRGSSELRLGIGASLVWCMLPASLLYGITRVNEPSAPRLGTLLTLFLATLLGALIVWLESRSATPLIPRRLLRVPGVWMPIAVTTLFGAAATSGLFVALSLLLQDGQGFSPTGAGTALLPLCLAAMVSASIVGRLAQYSSPRVVCIGSCVFIGAGLFVLAVAPLAGQYLAWMLPSLLMIGFGFPGVLLFPIEVASSAVTDTEKGLVAGLLNAATQLSGALGVAMYVGLSGTPSVAGGNPFRLAFAVSAAIALLIAPMAVMTKRTATTQANSPL